jgi:diguanylate cyclase
MAMDMRRERDSDGGPAQAGDARSRSLGFVDRIHLMRTLGLGLGVVPVASVLYQNGAAWYVWALLLANGYVWPHVAWRLARRSDDPRSTEFRNLVLDSAFGGAWIAVMQFNLLPSALLAVMLAIDKIGVAGWRFLGRTVLAQVVACLVVWTLLGFPLKPQTTMFNIALSLPFLLGYPLAISTLLYALARRVTRQNRLLELLNRSDPLTGLHNRRHWEEMVASELARFLRTRRPAVVMLIDVDNFKEVNDHHGHAAGDEVLRRISAVLRESLREIDVVARYGGDEFAVLITETDLRRARVVAERVRRLFLEHRGEQAEAERCTLSIGLAESDRLLATVDDWVRRADAAMYRAKASGRDRVDAA